MFNSIKERMVRGDSIVAAQFKGRPVREFVTVAGAPYYYLYKVYREGKK